MFASQMGDWSLRYAQTLPQNPARNLARLVSAMFLLIGGGALCAQVSTCEKNCISPTSDCQELRHENPKLFGQCVAACKKACQEQTTPPVTLHPRYMVLGIIYAPPGCTSSANMQCNGSSSVDYAGGSALGTKVAVKDSFKVGFSITVDGLGALGSAGASAGFAGTQTDSSSVAITKTGSLDLKAPGNADGIDHGQDQFILVLNPTVTLRKQNGNLYWQPGYDGPSMARYEVYVSELRNPASMRPSVAAVLKARGFTTDDYQTILKLSPFGGCVVTGGGIGTLPCGGTVATTGGLSPGLDPTRFRPTAWSIPYEPPLQSPSCNNGICNCPATTINLKNEFVNENSHEAESEYTVNLNTSIGVPEVWDLKTSWSFTWTDTSTNTSTTDSTQSASATIACPSVNYTGPTFMQVYWDSLYGSFVFVPYDLSTAAILQQGTVTDAANKPLAGQQIDLTVAGKKYHTITGPNGAYRFVALPGQTVSSQSAQITVRNVAHTVTLGSPQPTKIQVK